MCDSILPIEQSIKSGPNVFPKLLDYSLLLVSLILASFGTVGYLTFGDDVHDIIVRDLPSSGPTVALKSCLIVGIFFTYPLQILPVTRIFEGFVMHIVHDGKAHIMQDEEEDTERVKPDSEDDELSSKLGKSKSQISPPPTSTEREDAEVTEDSRFVPAEDDYQHYQAVGRTPPDTARVRAGSELGLMRQCIKRYPDLMRNLIRTIVVLLTALVSVVVPSFHSVISLVGSLGAASLAFIIPAMMNIRINRSRGTEGR